MPATLAQLQDRLDGLNEAIASGALSVSYEGKSVTYRSLAEMRSARDDLMRQLGLPVASRRTVASFNGGFGYQSGGNDRYRF